MLTLEFTIGSEQFVLTLEFTIGSEQFVLTLEFTIGSEQFVLTQEFTELISGICVNSNIQRLDLINLC